MKTFRLLCIACALMLGAPAVPAQVGLKTAADFYEDAVRRYEAASYVEALVQLKNALQQDPDHLPSLILMGRSYIERKDGAAAEEALRTALARGADPALVKLPLAEAYLIQGKAARMVSELTPAGLPDAARARMMALRARGFIALHRHRDAAAELAAARKLAPTAPEPLIEQVALSLATGDISEAEQAAVRLVELAPDDPEAWNASGSVAHAKSDFETALKRYDRALELDAFHFRARVARVAILLDLNRDDETADDLLFLAREHPAEPRSSYLRAVKLARAGDEQGARRELESTIEVIDALPRNMVESDSDLLLVAGMTSYGLNALENARRFLESYITLKPKATGARKVLGNTLLRLGLPENASEVLRATIDIDPYDTEALTLLAAAYSRLGRDREATKVLMRAHRLAETDPAIRARLAVAQFDSGAVNEGIAGLAEVFDTAPENRTAGLMLAMAHLKEGDTEAAIATVDQLLTNAPDNPVFVNLRGVARMAAGNRGQARRDFERALEMAPEYLPAAINLGKLDTLEGRLPRARERLTALNAAYPEDPKILLELARLEAAAGNTRKAEQWANDARRSDEGYLDAYRFLVDFHLARGNTEQALKTAFDAERAAPDNLAALAMLSELLIRTGDTERARLFLKRLVDKAEFDTEWLTRAGNNQAAIGELENARYTLYKAVQGDPDSIRANVSYIELHLRTQQFDKAGELIAAFAERFPESPEGPRLAGDLAFLEGDIEAARAHFSRALALRPSTALLLRKIETYVAANELGAAKPVLESWLERHPGDTAARRALSEVHIALRELEAADRELRRLLEAMPDRPELLNNHANVLFGLDRREEALAQANRAYELAPDNANVADTLGWLFVQTGRPEEGLSLLREASARRADNQEIRFHLAVALHRLGRNAEARRILDDVIATERAFPGLADARKLRQELAGK